MATSQPKLFPREIPGAPFLKRVSEWERKTGQKYTPPKGSIEYRVMQGNPRNNPWYGNLNGNPLFQPQSRPSIKEPSNYFGLLGEAGGNLNQPIDAEPGTLGSLYNMLPNLPDVLSPSEELKTRREMGLDYVRSDKLWENYLHEKNLEKEVIKRANTKDASDDPTTEVQSTGQKVVSSPGSVPKTIETQSQDDYIIDESWNALPVNLSENQSLNKIPARLNVSGRNSVEKNKALINSLPEYFRDMDQLSLEARYYE